MKKLNEAQRIIKRYYIRPQNIFCSKKEDILKALVSIGDNNCSVYSLKSLEDHDDVQLLKPSDIIYYYDEGVLYDKNHVKVMDYDLNVKYEEERKKFADIDAISDETFDAAYEDRLTEEAEVLEEDTIYVGKLSEYFELPPEIKLINKDLVEKIVNDLRPEEEFTVGYINPVYLYKELWDKLPIYKCTEFSGYTGVDFADSADEVNADKDIRIAKAKQQIADAQSSGSQIKTGSDVDYSLQNKLVRRQRTYGDKPEQHNTILFYPTTAPKVCYFVKLPIKDSFIKLNSEQLEKHIYDNLDKIETKLDLAKVRNKVHTTIFGKDAIDIDRETADGVKIDTRYIYKYGREKLGVRALYTSQLYYISIPDYTTRGNTIVENFNPFKLDFNVNTKSNVSLNEKYTLKELDLEIKKSRLPLELGHNANDVDFVGHFSDGGYYSDTTYSVEFDDGIYRVYYDYNSDDGDVIEGDYFEFDSFEEFVDWLKDADLENCPINIKVEALDQITEKINLKEAWTKDDEREFNLQYLAKQKAYLNSVKGVKGSPITLVRAKDRGKNKREYHGEVDSFFVSKNTGAFMVKINKIKNEDPNTFVTAQVESFFKPQINYNKAGLPTDWKNSISTSDTALKVEFEYWKKTRSSRIKRINNDARSLSNRQHKVDDTYKAVENLSPQEFAIVAKWLWENTKDIQFRVPKIDDDLAKLDTTNLSLEKADNLRDKIIKKFDRLEAEFRREIPNAKEGTDFTYRLTSAENDTHYADWWGLSGKISFNRPIADAPIEVINLIKKAQDIARRNGIQVQDIEVVKQNKVLDSYYFCLMVIKLFGGDLYFYEGQLPNLPKIEPKEEESADEIKTQPITPEEVDNPFEQTFEALKNKLTESKAEICCICGEEIEGYGNNPAPYKEEGKCCDACNLKFVIPARLEQIKADE